MEIKTNEKKFRPNWWIRLSKVGFFVFLVISIPTIFERFWVGVFFFFISILFHPKTHFIVSEKLTLKFNWLVKLICFITLFTAAGFSSSYYDERDAIIDKEKKEEELRLKREIEAKRIEEESLEKIRKDSLSYYYNLTLKNAQKRKYTTAVRYIDESLRFATNEKDSILEQRTKLFYKSKQYSKALQEYSEYINLNKNTSENLYMRALCYLKLRKKQKAVNDLKQSIKYGNEEADKLHEKINPLRKRVSYYLTRCCDGSTSGAKGRGACSHHGGVCNWNEPVYENYRKY